MTLDQRAYLIRPHQGTFKGLLQTILMQGTPKEYLNQYLYVREKVALGHFIQEDNSYKISDQEKIYFTDNPIQLNNFNLGINTGKFEVISGFYISDEEIMETINFGRLHERSREALANIAKKITIESNTSYFKK